MCVESLTFAAIVSYLRKLHVCQHVMYYVRNKFVFFAILTVIELSTVEKFKQKKQESPLINTLQLGIFQDNITLYQSS